MEEQNRAIPQPPPDAQLLTDGFTGRTIWQLSESSKRHIHAYFDLCPWSPSGDEATYFEHQPGDPAGAVILHCLTDGRKRSIGRTRCFNAHTGALQQWHPDGRSVLYCDEMDGLPAFSRVDVQTDRRHTSLGRLRMVSPDGTHVLFGGRSGHDENDEAVLRKQEHGVVLTDVNAARPGRLIISVADALELNPRRAEIADWHIYIKHTKWSPDGSRFFFVFTNEILYDRKYGELPRVKDLYVARADGSALRWLGEFGHHPSWHPNGRQILFVQPVEGVERFVLTDVDTRERTLFLSAIASGHPSLSPDGRRIITDYRPRSDGALVPANRWGLTLYDLASERQELIVTSPANGDTEWSRNDPHPVWHPDGAMIMYNDYRTGRPQVCVVLVD